MNGQKKEIELYIRNTNPLGKLGNIDIFMVATRYKGSEKILENRRG